VVSSSKNREAPTSPSAAGKGVVTRTLQTAAAVTGDALRDTLKRAITVAVDAAVNEVMEQGAKVLSDAAEKLRQTPPAEPPKPKRIQVHARIKR